MTARYLIAVPVYMRDPMPLMAQVIEENSGTVTIAPASPGKLTRTLSRHGYRFRYFDTEGGARAYFLDMLNHCELNYADKAQSRADKAWAKFYKNVLHYSRGWTDEGNTE